LFFFQELHKRTSKEEGLAPAARTSARRVTPTVVPHDGFAQKHLNSIKLLACEAGASISLGRKPQDQLKNIDRAREMGDSMNFFELSPAGAGSFFNFDLNLGLAPQALCLRLLRRLRFFVQSCPQR
jgi:MoaA/NifB/PqqE/SkfB family radical SAM enzyme